MGAVDYTSSISEPDHYSAERTREPVGDWKKLGLRFVVIGLGAAAIGFAIGNLFHAAGG